jgi:hypothetical protein
MPRVTVLLAVMVLSSAAGAQQGGIARELTPAIIEEAIAAGERGRVPDGILQPFSRMWGSGPHVATFSTPFMRIAAAALDAKRNYRKFTAADVTSDLSAVELHVYAWAQTQGPAVANVTTVVITPKKGSQDEKAARAIRPTRFESIPTSFKNLFGAEFSGDSKLAVFPLDVLSEQHEVHVVYDRPVGEGQTSCSDCAAPFKLKNVR